MVLDLIYHILVENSGLLVEFLDASEISRSWGEIWGLAHEVEGGKPIGAQTQQMVPMMLIRT